MLPKMRILVVDDEPKIRRGLRKLISQFDNKYEVDVATNGEHALELVDSFKPEVVFLDINMPLMNGLTFAKIIKEKNPYILFIIVSGYAEFDYAKEAISIGILDYILKPIMPDKIKLSLQKAENKLKKIYSEKEKSSYYIKKSILEIIIDKNNKSLEEILKINDNYRIVYGKNLNLKEDYNYNISQREKENIKNYIKEKFDNSQNIISFFYNNNLLIIFIGDEYDKFQLKSKFENSKYDFLEYFISEFYNTKDSFYKNLKKLLINISSDSKLEIVKNDEINGISNKIIAYIEENYHKKINLTDISNLVYMHSTHVSKLFKKETGINISDYIINYRIKIAKELLCDSQYKIYDVAYKVGFNGSKYFINVFKTKTGMTPSEFRNKNIN